MKQKHKESLTETLLIRMTRAERARLEQAARREQRSMAAQVRVFMTRGLEQLQPAA